MIFSHLKVPNVGSGIVPLNTCFCNWVITVNTCAGKFAVNDFAKQNWLFCSIKIRAKYTPECLQRSSMLNYILLTFKFNLVSTCVFLFIKFWTFEFEPETLILMHSNSFHFKYKSLKFWTQWPVFASYKLTSQLINLLQHPTFPNGKTPWIH